MGTDADTLKQRARRLYELGRLRGALGWSIPALIVPRASVGKLGGIVNFVCQVSGITAQILTGYIVGATHSYALAFGVSAVYLILGIAGYLFLLQRIEPIRLGYSPAA